MLEAREYYISFIGFVGLVSGFDFFRFSENHLHCVIARLDRGEFLIDWGFECHRFLSLFVCAFGCLGLLCDVSKLLLLFSLLLKLEPLDCQGGA